MKQRAGFTIVELLITITIMVILLALAVVNLRSNEASDTGASEYSVREIGPHKLSGLSFGA